jgi:hypothetical protein
MATGCLGGGSKPSSTPPVNTALVGDYAATIAAVDNDLDSYATGLSSCTSATYDCIVRIDSAGAAASFLVTHLGEDATESQPLGNVPALVSSLIAKTTSDATTVRKQAAVISRFSRTAISNFRTQLSALTADVDAWQPTGIAGRIVAQDRIHVPLTPPANLHLHFNVRPLLYIKQNSFIPTFTTSGSHCSGAGLLSDLKRGASVTIYNASGQKIVGLGYIVRTAVEGNRCALVGDVRGLPIESFYQVRFTNRNKVPFTERALVTQSAYSSFG